MMIQDIYRTEPWKMLICCIMLNQTSGVQVKKVMRPFFKKFSSLDKINKASEKDIADKLVTLGFQNVKANRIKAFAKAFNPDMDIKRDGLIGFPGIGDYAIESAEVFINRRRDFEAKDKEIKKYLEESVSSADLKAQVSHSLNIDGHEGGLKRYETLAIINHSYEYSSDVFFDITDERLKYVKDKLNDYKTHIEDAIYRLRWNKWNRQATILFDQSGVLPNCTVCMQFQIWNNALYVSVYQRSQDIEKLEMDCEIFNRFALEVIKEIDDLDDYDVKVFVGNMHKYLR